MTRQSPQQLRVLLSLFGIAKMYSQIYDPYLNSVTAYLTVQAEMNYVILTSINEAKLTNWYIFTKRRKRSTEDLKAIIVFIKQGKGNKLLVKLHLEVQLLFYLFFKNNNVKSIPDNWADPTLYAAQCLVHKWCNSQTLNFIYLFFSKFTSSLLWSQWLYSFFFLSLSCAWSWSYWILNIVTFFIYHVCPWSSCQRLFLLFRL